MTPTNRLFQLVKIAQLCPIHNGNAINIVYLKYPPLARTSSTISGELIPERTKVAMSKAIVQLTLLISILCGVIDELRVDYHFSSDGIFSNLLNGK